MARGIWKNSFLKIILTRSFLGEVFRPFLYSPEEHVHYTFLEAMNTVTAPIFSLQDFKSRGLAYFWIFEVPRTMFEEVFFPDDEEQAASCFIDFFKTKDGTELAYLTQAYVWYYLEHVLKSNDSTLAPYSKDIHNLSAFISSIFLSESKTSYYYDRFTFIAASSIDAIAQESALLYIAETISFLANKKKSDSTFSVLPELMQASSRKCIWKLENAKYTTITMLNAWK